MHRIILIGVGGFALINAAYIFGAPQHWYDNVPGVTATGPLNFHFAKDIALAFLSSGIALIWAGAKGNASVAMFGVAWLMFHALFHVWIWMHRGFPTDLVAFVNLVGIQLPAGLAVFGAAALKAQGEEQ